MDTKVAGLAPASRARSSRRLPISSAAPCGEKDGPGVAEPGAAASAAGVPGYPARGSASPAIRSALGLNPPLPPQGAAFQGLPAFLPPSLPGRRGWTPAAGVSPTHTLQGTERGGSEIRRPALPVPKGNSTKHASCAGGGAQACGSRRGSPSGSKADGPRLPLRLASGDVLGASGETRLKKGEGGGLEARLKRSSQSGSLRHLPQSG